MADKTVGIEQMTAGETSELEAAIATYNQAGNAVATLQAQIVEAAVNRYMAKNPGDQEPMNGVLESGQVRIVHASQGGGLARARK